MADHLPRILPLVLPIVLAVMMAFIFRHPAMLMFGLLGPLLTLSGWWQKKREAAKQAEDRDDQQREHDETTQREQSLKRSQWLDHELRTHPAVTDWLQNPLWRAAANTADARVRVGRGVVTPPPAIGIHQPVAGAPLSIPLHHSLALVGTGLHAMATWRALSAQAMAIISAANVGNTPRVSVSELWAKNADVPRLLDIPHPGGDHSHRWCFVDSSTQVPPQVTWVVVVDAGGMARLFHRGSVTHDQVQPDTLSFAQSRWVRARLVEAEGEGRGDAPTITASDRCALWADLSSDQPAIDLVAQGPHTLVWGKTGSGKSVLLHRLVASLCSRYSPDQLALVGIDFKGGATLSPLMAYPHGAGLLTDLTPAATSRVTASLRAEIIRREHLFAKHRVASWQDLPDSVVCPRVLIVVDEAGVVAHDAPELMSVLSDIASRGRSLGVHLMISTQRPHHLPRNIIANCALRLCLGVTDADEASQYAPDIPRHLLASLRHSPPGTVVIPANDGTYRLTTVDTTQPTVDWPPHTQRQLWCDELPENITARDLTPIGSPPDGGYVVGLADYPDRQSQEVWTYQPARHGPLVIVGESGSGHTTCLTQLASHADTSDIEVVWGSDDPAVLAWQLMSHRGRRADTARQIFVVDRLDRTLQGVSADGQAWIIDALETQALQLSERGDGSAAVITTTPGNTVATALSRWNATTVLLRHKDPTLWALGGGEPALHNPLASPGRAVVGQVAMQWCHPAVATRPGGHTVSLAQKPKGALLISPVSVERDGASWCTPSEAEDRWQEVKEAVGKGPGVVCSEVSVWQMRQWCPPGHTTPPVVAAWPWGWHLHPGGVTLVSCED